MYSSDNHPVHETPDGVFRTTQWSVVLLAGQSGSEAAQEALEKLCRTYWYPLYAYVRHRGCRTQDAQDFTQEFFARFLERKHVALADPARGRFRAFLLTSMKNFLINRWEKGRSERRGGARHFISWEVMDAEGRFRAEPVDGVTPETAFEKRWAVTVLEQALDRLREEQEAAGKRDAFEQFKHILWGGRGGLTYAALAATLGMTEGAVKVAVYRLRQRFRELLRAEIAHTVANPSEIDDELRHLVSVMGS
jgi:RNA polymerase sigma-70 factor (ECF subfamily)